MDDTTGTTNTDTNANTIDVVVYKETQGEEAYINPEFTDIVDINKTPLWLGPDKRIGIDCTPVVGGGTKTTSRYQHSEMPWVVRTERTPVGGLSVAYTLCIYVELPVVTAAGDFASRDEHTIHLHRTPQVDGIEA